WNSPNQNTVGNGPALGGDFNAHHLIIESTGNGMVYLGGGGTSIITGSFTVNNGNVGLNKSGTKIVNIEGNLNLNGGTLQKGGSGTAVVNFSGNTTQTYTNEGTMINGAI